MANHDELIDGEHTWQKPFYRLLHANLPEHRSNYLPDALLNVTKLARDLGISKQAIYIWLSENKFSCNRLLSLCNLDGSTLTVEKLLPFGAFKN